MPKIDSRLPVLQRSLSLRADSLDADKRTVDLVFATERAAPMWHWELGDYDEILECREGPCDLERMKLGGALLSEHDRTKQIGVIEKIGFANGQGIATARFGTGPLAEQEWKDVQAGIRRNFSVSYRVKELTAEKVSDDDGNVYRATSWEPLEISLVSVPADVNCQAIRSAKDHKENTQPTRLRIPSTLQLSDTMKRSYPQFFREADTGANATTGTAATPPAPSEAEINRRAQELADKRDKDRKENVAQLREAATAFRETDMPVPEEMLNEALDKGTPVDQFRTAVIAHYRALKKNVRPTASGQSGSGVQVVGERTENLTIAQRFTRSQAYKDIQHARSQGAKVCAIELDEFDNFRATFATSSITNYSGIVQPGIVTIGMQRPTVADLLTQGTTGLNSVPYILETAFTPAATVVAQGAAKPEATFTMSQETAAVKKIAVTIPVTDEAFEDVPTLETLITNRLRYSVEIEEEDELINGDGTGAHLLGILNTPNILTQAKGADTVADAIHKGITKIKTQGFADPTGIIFHPNDWQDLKLTKDANGQYYAGGPFTGSYGQPFPNVERCWGLPVVSTTSATENTAIIVTMMDGIILRKKGITIDSTNSHASEFTSNIVRLRAEERLAFYIQRPKSFATVTGI